MDSADAPLDKTDSTSNWTNRIIDSIITQRNPSSILKFKRQPLANKLISLEKAVVPSRKNDTPGMIMDLLSELIRLGAILPHEAAPLYSDLLIRVHKYSSSNVNNNLETLVNDIRMLQSDAIRNTDVPNLTNQVLINSFLNSLPKTVPLGQFNYESFKQTLRLFVNEAPNVIVFKSGAQTLLQVNIRGVTTVNLNDAFQNMNFFWGVLVSGDKIPGTITSKLAANTRVLMFLLAPFTNNDTFTPDSFLSVLMNLYRETISSSADNPQATETEVLQIARDLGADITDVNRTLGYLIKSREDEISNPRSLTPRQLHVLRYVQESLIDRIEKNGEEPQYALENLIYSFSPSYFQEHGTFLRKLIAYMEIALKNSPSFFREIYSNKYWTPPQSFWSNNYQDFFNERKLESRVEPIQNDDYVWDDDDFFSTRSFTPKNEDLSVSSSSSSSVATLPNVVKPSNTVSTYNSVPVSPYMSMRDSIQRTIAKTVVPGLSGAIGRRVGEAVVPGSGDIVGPAASFLASQLLNSKLARQRLFQTARNRHQYIRESKQPVADTDSIASESSSNTINNKDFGGVGVSVNRFAYLAPKGGPTR